MSEQPEKVYTCTVTPEELASVFKGGDAIHITFGYDTGTTRAFAAYLIKGGKQIVTIGIPVRFLNDMNIEDALTKLSIIIARGLDHMVKHGAA